MLKANSMAFVEPFPASSLLGQQHRSISATTPLARSQVLGSSKPAAAVNSERALFPAFRLVLAGSVAAASLGFARSARRHKPRRRTMLMAVLETATDSNTKRPSRASTQRFREVVSNLPHVGKSPAEKALAVNLDESFYGSFAEIGAGQEVSRTFLKAGAAAGTVARSISAYDMRISDCMYGETNRYVTRERLTQMLDCEYKEVENTLRERRGPSTRFFAFASTLAARAYNSNKECEGWVGVTYQASVGQPKSTIAIHVRMRDPTAQLQGEAIGVLGTNLLYLASRTSDPYLITSFLLDGLGLNDAESTGRLEVDFIDFSGPAFPEESWDPRLLAMRMVQLRISVGVLLEPREDGMGYRQAVPNDALYKRPVVVQRSRFAPVTNMHEEVMNACVRNLEDEIPTEQGRRPLEILNLQIDDIIQPKELVGTETRIKNFNEMAKLDVNEEGILDIEELSHLFGEKLSDDEIAAISQDLDVEGKGTMAIDALFSMCSESIVAMEFLDRFAMLEPLGKSVLISSIRRTHELATYLRRYTKEKMAVAVGGGNYSMQRALFSEDAQLEALGRLFAQGSTRVFAYPSFDKDGHMIEASDIEGPAGSLYNYLVQAGSIVPIATKYMSDGASDPSRNQAIRLGSHEVRDLISSGALDWETYVPPEVVNKAKHGKWFDRLLRGRAFAQRVFDILANM